MIEFRQYAFKGKSRQRRGLVVALIDPDIRQFAVGYSLCKLTDKFDPAEGYKIALTRAEKNLAKVRAGTSYGIATLDSLPPFAFSDTASRVSDRITRIFRAFDRQTAKKAVRKSRRKTTKKVARK